MNKQERIQAIERIIRQYVNNCPKSPNNKPYDTKDLATAIEEAIGVDEDKISKICEETIPDLKMFRGSFHIAKELVANKEVITINENTD